jgi:putative tryptophan/tyrosine transport system substrate-binding protein
MKRRTFIAWLGVLVGTSPAWAQSARRVHRIAFVQPALPVAALIEESPDSNIRAFFKELRARGYVEGDNIVIERYSGMGQADQSADLAKRVVGTRPDVIVVTSRRILQHFHEATRTTPVPVIAAGTIDPVGYGVAASLARPGGNITGFTTDAGLEGLAKHIQLLREVSPGATRIAWLAPEETWPALYGRSMQEAAKQAGVTLLGPGVSNPIREAEYRRVFAAMAASHPDGLIVGDVSDNHTHARLIVELASALRVPTIYPTTQYTRHGGLMSYGHNREETYLGAAVYVDRVLKGEKPGDLPFQRPSKFDLVVNLKAAKLLGLEFPSSLLARADEIIE